MKQYDSQIKELWGIVPSSIIGARIGKPSSYVRTRARRMGLARLRGGRAQVGRENGMRKQVIRRMAREFMAWRERQMQ